MIRFIFIVIVIISFSCSGSAQNTDCDDRVSKLIEAGQDFEAKSNWAEAIDRYTRASEGAKKRSNAYCLATAYRSLARVHLTVGDFFSDIGAQYLEEFSALRSFQAINLHEEAERYYREAFQISKKAGDTLSMSYAKYGLGIVEFKRQNYPSSIAEYNKVDEWVDQAVKTSGSDSLTQKYANLKAWIMNARGLALFEQGKKRLDTLQVGRSIRDFKHLEEIFADPDNGVSLIEPYHNLGLAYDWMGKTDSSLYYNHRSLPLAEKNSSLFDMSKSWYGLSKNFEEMERSDSAYYYLKKYSDSHDELISVEQSKLLTQFKALLKFKEKEAEIKQLKILVFIICVVLILLAVIVVYSIQKRKALKKIANQKINDLLQQQEIYSLQGVLTGQESERRRIAQDLHDKLGAILGMVKLHFSAVEERLDALKAENKAQYKKANALLDQAADEVRNISHNLVSGVLTKFGLVPALKDLKETVEATGKLKIELIVSDRVKRLGGEQELQLYRIIQELVSNILKHARASEASIQLNRTNGQINLIVEDNGVGFDPEKAREKGGIGLKNLEARVNTLDGTIHFDSGKGAGTTVSIDIPLKDDPQRSP